MPIFPATPRERGRPPAGGRLPTIPSGRGVRARSSNWEKEIPIQPEDAPFRSAILPIPRKLRGPLEISQPIDAPPKPLRSRSRNRPLPKPQPELELDFAEACAAPEPSARSQAGVRTATGVRATCAEPIAPPPELAPEKPMLRPAVASAPAIPLVNPREPSSEAACRCRAAPSAGCARAARAWAPSLDAASRRPSRTTTTPAGHGGVQVQGGGTSGPARPPARAAGLARGARGRPRDRSGR